MKKFALYFTLMAMGMVLLQSCSEDSETQINESSITVNFSGLEDLGSDYAYEGWIIVNGAPVSTGVFNIDANGNASESTFNVNTEDIDNASTFVLTIEPSPDNDPAPTATHILAGDLTGSLSQLTVDHPAALADDFTSSTGTYILATPTDGANDSDETSGVWWLDPTDGPSAGLALPTLPEGWAYEGWAVIDGQPVSTGTFTSVSGSDSFNGFSGSANGPAYPGEDFLVNAPDGLTFPTDLRGKTVVISVEPVPDNSPAPFTLKPLVSQVADDAIDHTPLGMRNNASATNPTGRISINLSDPQ